MLPDFIIENSIGSLVAGIDEAGRGPLAGPVVAAAVMLPKHFSPDGINDSKKMTAKARLREYQRIVSTCHYAVGIVCVEEIEKLNILQATLLAMKKAADSLAIQADAFIVDGNVAPHITSAKVHTLIKGDSKSLCVASASIVAKVTRDTIMHDLHQIFPQYQWLKNYGYGTKQHYQAIEEHGLTIHHRPSFLKKYAARIAIK